MNKTVQKRLARSEVHDSLTWDLNDLYPSDKEWEDALNEIESDVKNFDDFKGTLHTGPKALLECLTAQEELTKKLVKVRTYASLKQSADGTDPVNQANSAKIGALGTKAMAALSFILSEILEFDEGKAEEFIQAEEGLQPFKKTLLELLETKIHKLSPETEQVLAALGEVHSAPYNIYNMAKLADMEFLPIRDEEDNELPVSFALFESRYEFSPDTYVRRKAYDSFVSTLKQYKNTIAATYATEVKKQVTLAKLRNYESVTDMLLEPQQVTKEMYNNQIDIIYKELAPHMRRFAQLKKKVLGLDKMMFCDLKAPFDPDFDPQITYDEARQLITDSLKIMGPDYTAMIEKGFEDRWVDLADNIGKSTGAFCSSPYGSHPYILITWADNMRGCFTLAHEFGHAGHFYLANKNQRIMNVRPSMYFIEAPSTMNEMLLAQYLLDKNKDNPQMIRWVVLQLLGTYYHNFVTHLLEAEFQRRVYAHTEAGNALTAKTLTEMKTEVLTGSGAIQSKSMKEQVSPGCASHITIWACIHTPTPPA
jgi:oligoendopeptidase F